MGIGKTGLGTLAAESAIETIPQRAGEDLVLGQQVASEFGRIADYLGMDGEELTVTSCGEIIFAVRASLPSLDSSRTLASTLVSTRSLSTLPL